MPTEFSGKTQMGLRAEPSHWACDGLDMAQRPERGWGGGILLWGTQGKNTKQRGTQWYLGAGEETYPGPR